MNQLTAAHKFFVKESRSFVAGHRAIKWKTIETYFPVRGSRTIWYYPFSIKELFYYPIAYVKFMWLTLKGMVNYE